LNLSSGIIASGGRVWNSETLSEFGANFPKGSFVWRKAQSEAALAPTQPCDGGQITPSFLNPTFTHFQKVPTVIMFALSYFRVQF
jgi:hypothetical protein